MNTTSLSAQIARELCPHAPFDSMTEADLQWLTQRLTVVYFNEGRILLAPDHSGEPSLHILKKGVVRSEDPNANTPYLELHEGEMFPLGAMLSRRPVISSYRAGADTFVYLLAPADFQQLLNISEPFRDFCTKRLAHLLELSRQRIQSALTTRNNQQHSDTPLGTLAHTPITCAPDTTLGEVLRQMKEKRIGSMIMTEGESKPVGIFTLVDVLTHAAKATPLATPISQLMSTTLVTLPPTALTFDAALTMARHRIRHLLIVERDKLIGIVAERDLFSLQRIGVYEIATAMDNAHDVETLAQISRDIRQLASNMLAQGVAPEQLTQLISTLNDRLVERVVELAFEGAALQGIALCWLAFGSEGRQEQTIGTDQDNGIIFQAPDGMSNAEARAILLPVAQQANDWLAACGFSLCKGNVMARNPDCCLSLAEWRLQFGDWIESANQQNLLNAKIYFDLRPVWGEFWMAYEVREHLLKCIKEQPRFLHALTHNTLEYKPPLSLLGDFVLSTHDGKTGLDLKVNGTLFFVDAARIFSLAYGIDAYSTAQRLRLYGEAAGVRPETVEGWVQAFHFLLLLRLQHQQQAIDKGEEPDNSIDPKTLSGLDRRILKETLRQARKLQSRLAESYRI